MLRELICEHRYSCFPRSTNFRWLRASCWISPKWTLPKWTQIQNRTKRIAQIPIYILTKKECLHCIIIRCHTLLKYAFRSIRKFTCILHIEIHLLPATFDRKIITFLCQSVFRTKEINFYRLHIDLLRGAFCFVLHLNLKGRMSFDFRLFQCNKMLYSINANSNSKGVIY